MTQQHHLNHATWDCKYHVVFIPKYRKKAIFGKIKKKPWLRVPRLGPAAGMPDRGGPFDA